MTEYIVAIVYVHWQWRTAARHGKNKKHHVKQDLNPIGLGLMM